MTRYNCFIHLNTHSLQLESTGTINLSTSHNLIAINIPHLALLPNNLNTTLLQSPNGLPLLLRLLTLRPLPNLLSAPLLNPLLLPTPPPSSSPLSQQALPSSVQSRPSQSSPCPCRLC